MAIQLREVMFHMRIVWSSEQDNCTRDEGEKRLQLRDEMTYNPWHLMMELDCAHVIEVTMKSEQATSVLRPNICKNIREGRMP